VRHLFAPEPTSRLTAATSDGEVTVALAVTLSRRFAELGVRARRGTPEAVTFGALVSSIRGHRRLSRLELARRAGLNPVYVAMLEMGILGPDEIPAVVVGKLAVGLERRLAELPATPYAAGLEPRDEAEQRPGVTRLRLGLDTLVPWVDALLTGSAASVWLPDLAVRAAEATWLVRDGQLTNAPAAGVRLDEYSLRIVGGAAAAGSWSLHAVVLDAAAGGPVAGAGLELQMGSQRRLAETDAVGEAHFADLDAADIEPLRLRAEPRP